MSDKKLSESLGTFSDFFSMVLPLGIVGNSHCPISPTILKELNIFSYGVTLFGNWPELSLV